MTGARGRLGRALVDALADAPFTGPAGPIAWARDAFDLDAPAGVLERLDADRPEVVVHCAAWTDVDGCALDPELAIKRNAFATRDLAEACADRGVDLLIVSTNEVFDGSRRDGHGYKPDEPLNPRNAYGASKAAAERLASEAFAARSGPGASLGIARTAWLFGAPGNDFPSRILDNAERAAAAGEPLRAVNDEWGTPTYTADVADAIVELLADDATGGIHHLVNGLFATRADWARYVVARAGVEVEVVDVPGSTWERPSDPPRWGVLEPTVLPSGEPMRPWPDAMADYAPALLRSRRIRA
ncbi:MAG: SDR family oxidoreductase [Chloroflexota bacterium]